MERQGLFRVGLGVVAVLVVVQSLLVGSMWCTRARTEERLEELERQVREARELGELGETIVDTAERLEDLEDEVDEIRLSSVASSGSIKKLDTRIEDMPDPEESLASIFPEIESMIDKKLAAHGGGGGPKMPIYPSMDQLAQTLELSEYQKSEMQSVIDAAKFEAFEVVNTKRSDGTSILDEFADTLLTSDKPRKDGMQVLMKLMVEDIPGTNETYFDRLMDIRRDALEEAGSSMSAEQAESLGSMKINVFGVDTGYNPLSEFFKGRMAE